MGMTSVCWHCFSGGMNLWRLQGHFTLLSKLSRFSVCSVSMINDDILTSNALQSTSSKNWHCVEIAMLCLPKQILVTMEGGSFNVPAAAVAAERCRRLTDNRSLSNEKYHTLCSRISWQTQNRLSSNKREREEREREIRTSTDCRTQRSTIVLWYFWHAITIVISIASSQRGLYVCVLRVGLLRTDNSSLHSNSIKHAHNSETDSTK